MKAFLLRLWRLIARPSVHFSLGFLTLGGFVAGVMFWGGFNTALEATNTESFCISLERAARAVSMLSSSPRPDLVRTEAIATVYSSKVTLPSPAESIHCSTSSTSAVVGW